MSKNQPKRPMPEECDSCGFETKNLDLFDNLDTALGGGGKVIWVSFWFCDLCAGTFTSNAHRHPQSYPNEMAMKTSCYIGNVILKRIDVLAKEGE